jgi:hypothetical protein
MRSADRDNPVEISSIVVVNSLEVGSLSRSPARNEASHTVTNNIDLTDGNTRLTVSVYGSSACIAESVKRSPWLIWIKRS